MKTQRIDLNAPLTVKKVASVVLWTADLPKTVRFYEALGLELAREEEGDGKVHYTLEIGGVHMRLLKADEPGYTAMRNQSGATQLGLRVDSLDSALARVMAIGANIVGEPEPTAWGKRALVEDPDGRPIEIGEEG